MEGVAFEDDLPEPPAVPPPAVAGLVVTALFATPFIALGVAGLLAAIAPERFPRLAGTWSELGTSTPAFVTILSLLIALAMSAHGVVIVQHARGRSVALARGMRGLFLVVAVFLLLSAGSLSGFLGPFWYIGFVTSLVGAMLAGWLSGRLVERTSYGLWRSLGIGIVGGVIGWMLRAPVVRWAPAMADDLGFLGSFAFTLAGSVLLVMGMRAVDNGRMPADARPRREA